MRKVVDCALKDNSPIPPSAESEADLEPRSSSSEPPPMLLKALLCSSVVLCSALRAAPLRPTQRLAALRMSDEVSRAQNPVVETNTIFDR